MRVPTNAYMVTTVMDSKTERRLLQRSAPRLSIPLPYLPYKAHGHESFKTRHIRIPHPDRTREPLLFSPSGAHRYADICLHRQKIAVPWVSHSRRRSAEFSFHRDGPSEQRPDRDPQCHLRLRRPLRHRDLPILPFPWRLLVPEIRQDPSTNHW